uniref:Uncharacterized protein n=1 Tax=Anguilla anguilla TaxID=7936 RepID=A0A0E9PB46_ANGAN
MCMAISGSKMGGIGAFSDATHTALLRQGLCLQLLHHCI